MRSSARGSTRSSSSSGISRAGCNRRARSFSEMETNARFLALLQSLRDATAEGRITWAETVEGDSFRLITDYASIRLSAEYDDNQERGWIMATLLDHQG